MNGVWEISMKEEEVKKTILAIFLFLLVFNLAEARVCASKYKYGLGVILGAPTSFTGKYWLNNKEAYDLSFGSKFNSYYELSGSYLYHRYDLFKNVKTLCDASLYYGGGLNLIFDKRRKYRNHHEDDNYDNILGVKGTIGFSYIIPQMPFEVFTELSPILNVTPLSNLDFNAGVGLRYMW